ncbi:MAG TPA: hypothetical protein PJ991_09885 [Kiritimatiellia bacterium]|nr:hypothetical protein [Kiritimatiellia bacterium]
MNLLVYFAFLRIGMMNAHSFLLFIVVLSSQTAYSQISRPAAYLDLSVPAGVSVAVAFPFDPFDSEILATIEKAIGSDAHIVSCDANEQTYATATDVHVGAGDAFWVINENDYPVTVFHTT